MYAYARNLAIQSPNIFWSLVIGSVGPVMLFTVPKVRREYFGFKGYEQLPFTYPLPAGPRKPTTGYEDSA